MLPVPAVLLARAGILPRGLALLGAGTLRTADAGCVLLVFGALPFWEELRKGNTTQSALRGVNAAVVGLLIAALYNPVWTSAITSATDFALAAAAFLLLFMWQTPPWLVVVLCAAAGAVLPHP